MQEPRQRQRQSQSAAIVRRRRRLTHHGAAGVRWRQHTPHTQHTLELTRVVMVVLVVAVAVAAGPLWVGHNMRAWAEERPLRTSGLGRVEVAAWRGMSSVSDY